MRSRRSSSSAPYWSGSSAVVEIVEPLAAGINAPEGIQFVPAAVTGSTDDDYLFVPVWKDDGGTPDRIVVVTILSTNTIAVISYSRHGNSWVHDNAVDVRDTSVTLNITASNLSEISAFAIESPGTSTDPILFIVTNDASQTPDTFEIDSIQLADGDTTLSAVVVTIAGANQPTDSNNMATASFALSTSRVMTFFQDDAHFADVTGNAAGFTFTYTDAKVLAVDTSIFAGQQVSGVLIGSQVVLMEAGQPPASTRLWEMSIAAVLTEEWNPFMTGLGGTHQSITNEHHGAITAIGGSFAVAYPVGGGDAAGDESAWIITTFPLDDI